MDYSKDKSYTITEATQKLMHYCAYRDRSQKEVEDKLNEMRMIPQAKEKIIIQLMQEDFLNEERFARSFARGKFRIKKWGKVKIKNELRKKQISEPIIKLGLSEINQKDYNSSLYDLAEKRIEKTNESNSYKKKQKVADHLMRKGYETHLVFDCLNELIP
ncbi:regulatory protein RecX [Gramella sp. AN32]|uniref:Regulatory protein RecX n=1 Tax=Christiangramia antarctica TaxID=2058158 RepID=A0ABW5WYC2_9FLAO|nr:regulatory protein RecX [Gramella sp. AN32]MCM4155243.1 recombinase RecX [Gramella sp. AN32]